MKRPGIVSQPYSFRLWKGNRWGVPDEAELKASLDGWIENTLSLVNPDGSPLAAGTSDATRLVMLDLIRWRLGKPAPAETGTSPNLEAFAADLEERILSNVRGLLANIAVNPDMLNVLVQAGEQYAEADDIPDDMFANMLDDFNGRQAGLDED